MRSIFIFLFTLVTSSLLGQKDNEIHQYFDFEEGIYLSHESLMRNTPDIKLSSNEDGIYNNPLKILRVNPSDFGLKAGQKIRYVVDQGLPYYRSVRCCPETEVYVGLTIVGRLSVVTYESEEMVDIPMTAYNPYNNRPFLTGSVKRERKTKVHKVIDMEDGKEYGIDDSGLQEKLGATFTDLDTLIDAVSRYNKEHKVYITK